jgi:hypothetical protein
MADVNPVGPIFAAGDEIITRDGYIITYLPDLHNDELQRAGKPPVYYWLPNAVRLARKNGDQGDYKFRMLHFVGIRGEDSHVGVEGKQEVSGGLIGFSTTCAPPAAVLQQMHDELLNRCRGTSDKYWGWRTQVAPMIRSAPIVSNTTSITNLLPNADGTVPAVGGGGGGAAPDPGAAGGGNGGGNGGAAPAGGGPPRMIRNGMRPRIIPAVAPPLYRLPPTVRQERGNRGSNLDPWYVNLQGQGAGSVSPLAENAYSGLMGSLPAAIFWGAFHGGSSAVTIWQHMMIKVWSPVCRIYIKGEWDKIQDHFSAAAHGGGLFWSADLQVEFNNLVMSGGIEAKVEVDSTLPNADKLEEAMNKQKELVFQKFMEAAQKTIFDPAPYHEEAAQASGGFLGFGGGGAMKLRRDRTHLKLEYEEKKELAYLQPFPIAGEMEGMAEHIAADPAAEKRYFTTLYLGDWERKVRRVIKPVVNWPDAAQKWVGQPVAFVSAQVGYPNTEGAIQWDGHLFQSNGGPNDVWETATEMKAAADVTNPPPGWKPDLTFIKRQVHFNEPPNETENPFVRISVEKNTVDLDPGENGSLLSDINNEVRVDNVGMLNVGPLYLNADLENAKQIIEVEFKARGQTAEGKDRPPVRFSWKFDDQAEPRYWMIFTGQPDFIPKFDYQVRVVVKGSIFTKGMEWVGPWVESGTNGPLMISVPTADDPGVQMRSLWKPGTLKARPRSAPPLALPAAAAPPASSRPPVSTPPAHGRPPAHVASAPPSSRGKAKAPVREEPGLRDIGGWTTLPDTTDWTSFPAERAEAGRSAPPRKTPRPAYAARSVAERTKKRS